MQFHVLGPLEAHTAQGVPVRLRARKPAALLAVLLLNANASVSIDHLIKAIWHEQAVPASALRNLRSYVWRLRGELGHRLESRPGGYRLTVQAGELDTDRVESLAAAARLAMADGAPAVAAGHLADALALWRGQAFDGLAFDAAVAEAARLDELRRELGELLAQAWLALGRYTEAAALLRELVAEDPLREGCWAQLVHTLHAAGRPAEARAAYDRARQLIVSELGVEPGPELVAAQRDIRLDGAAPRSFSDFTGPSPATAAASPTLTDRRPPAGPHPIADGGSAVMNTQQSGRLSLVTGSSPVPGTAGFDALLAAAVSEVLIMSAGTGPGPIGSFRRIDRDNLRRGVRYRVLAPDSERLSGRLSSLALAGAQVRTDAEVPMEAVVIDGRTALLPADRSGSDSLAGVAVFRLPSVVTATVGLFERIWPAAVPLTPSELPGDADTSALTCRERDLLVLLCSGSTDESAAARLGISVRTVRRMVADIMNRLGARSRFQAGAKAAGRGWLMDRAS